MRPRAFPSLPSLLSCVCVALLLPHLPDCMRLTKSSDFHYPLIHTLASHLTSNEWMRGRRETRGAGESEREKEGKRERMQVRVCLAEAAAAGAALLQSSSLQASSDPPSSSSLASLSLVASLTRQQLQAVRPHTRTPGARRLACDSVSVRESHDSLRLSSSV